MDININQRKLENVKGLAKSSGDYMVGIGVIAALAALPQTNNSINSFVDEENLLIIAGIVSLGGFLFTRQFSALTKEAIEYENIYWCKILYYWLYGVVYVLSCMIFEFAIRLFIYSRLPQWVTGISYIICIFFDILTTLQMRSYVKG